MADRVGCIKSYDEREALLTNFQEIEEPENVALGDGCVVKSLRFGRIQMNMLFPGT